MISQQLQNLRWIRINGLHQNEKYAIYWQKIDGDGRLRWGEITKTVRRMVGGNSHTLSTTIYGFNIPSILHQHEFMNQNFFKNHFFTVTPVQMHLKT